VTVCVKDDTFTAVVEDNGTGNPELSTEGLPAGKGLGLRSMRYRARQAGADYSFESREIGGTLVRINIPLVLKM
jgi:signal transduction histidine kinase